MVTTVRTAGSADIEQIKALDPNARSDSRRSVEIVEAVDKGDCYVAEHEGSITGYAVFRTDFFGCGFVWLLVVAEDRRRRGIGNALMVAIEHAGRSAKLFTSTNQSNAPMRALLAKRGYVEAGTIEGLDEGDPEVFYLKRLKR